MKTYYISIQNQVSINSYAAQGIAVISPAEAEEIDFNNSDQLIIDCEISKSETGAHKSSNDLYGIKIAQQLRLNDFKGKIVFVSQSTKQDVLKKKPGAEIILFKGHSFRQIPIVSDELLKAFDEVELLDELSLYDCKYHFCDIKGFINEALHSIKNKIGKNTFSFEVEQFINTLEKELKENYQELKTQIKDRKDQEVYRLLESQFKQEDKVVKKDIAFEPPKWRWEILWLDDELKVNNFLFQQFEKSGIKIHLCRTYSEAVTVWTEDYFLNKISLVICDYRLKEDDQISGKQGYDFLQYVGGSGKSVSMVAYSALPRKFLLNSIRMYNMFIHPFSKFDFDLDDRKDAEYLYDTFTYIGDNQWGIIHNQPTGSKFADWKDLYFDFRNTHEFLSYNSLANKIIEENLDSFINQIKELEANNEKINADLISEIKLPHRIKTRTNTNLGKKDKKNNDVAKEILLARRLYISIYAYLVENYYDDSFENLDFHQIVKLIVYNNNVEKKSKPDVEKKSKSDIGNIIKTATQGYTFLALELPTTYPQGLFIEEYQFLTKQNLLNNTYLENIKNTTKTLDKINNKIKTVFDENANFKALLKPLSEKIIQKAEDVDVSYQELNFKSSYNTKSSKEVTIYFSKDNYPCINQIETLKHLLIYLNNQINPSSIRNDYENTLRKYITFLKYVRKISSRENSTKEISSLVFFIDNSISGISTEELLKNRKRSESRIEEYTRLYVPWELWLPSMATFDNEEDYEKAVAIRINNFKNACLDFSKVNPKIKLYKDVNHQYKHYIKKGETGNIVNKAIYSVIFAYRNRMNLKISIEKEGNKPDFDIVTSKSQAEDEFKKVKNDFLVLSTKSQVNDFNFIFKTSDENQDTLKKSFVTLFNELSLQPTEDLQVIVVSVKTIEDKLIDNKSDFVGVLMHFRLDSYSDECISNINNLHLGKNEFPIILPLQ